MKHIICVFVMLLTLVSYAHACEIHEGIAQQEKQQQQDKQ